MDTLRLEVPGQPGTTVYVEIHHPDSPTTVLVVSGLGLPVPAWHAVVAALPDLCVVLVDRPGIGRSTPWASPPLGLASQVDLLRLVLDRSRPDAARSPVVVVGHSSGALAAEGFARRHPALTGALLLVDPTEPTAEATRRQLEGLPSALLLWVVSRRGAIRLVGPVVGSLTVAIGTARRPTGSATRAVRRAFGQGDHLRATLLELAQIRAEAADVVALAAVRPLPDCPVHLVVGTRTGWPFRWLRRVRTTWLRRVGTHARDLAPQTRITEVDGAHLLMLDSPAAVAHAIAAIAPTAR